MVEENRILSPNSNSDEESTEFSLRPKVFDEYIGQQRVKENLSVYIEAAKNREE
ncbi:MAG: Holliday junction branch migration DNA helicase RuvB, partial [Oscillospiraceae bacterium]